MGHQTRSRVKKECDDNALIMRKGLRTQSRRAWSVTQGGRAGRGVCAHCSLGCHCSQLGASVMLPPLRTMQIYSVFGSRGNPCACADYQISVNVIGPWVRFSANR